MGEPWVSCCPSLNAPYVSSKDSQDPASLGYFTNTGSKRSKFGLISPTVLHTQPLPELAQRAPRQAARAALLVAGGGLGNCMGVVVLGPSLHGRDRWLLLL